MQVVKFGEFVKESHRINESVNLYRLVSVGENEDLVVDTEDPGKYYFKSESDINKEALSKKGKEYHVIEVETDDSNIDDSLSEQESEKQGCECVVLKDGTKAKIKSITPFL